MPEIEGLSLFGYGCGSHRSVTEFVLLELASSSCVLSIPLS